MIDRAVASPLKRPACLPLKPPETVTRLGPTVVIAPHPDDETLGCGGLITLLGAREIPVSVLVISDGTGSHRHSKRYPAERLRRLRQRETVAALNELTHGHASVAFLDLPDERVPFQGDDRFNEAVRRCAEAIASMAYTPSTVAVTWRRDPHRDHQASWQITRRALSSLGVRPRVLEYPVWVSELGDPTDYPAPGEMHAWRLDIGPALDAKLAAIDRHRSQTTDLIDDDPFGFRLTRQTLNRLSRPWEIFLEEPDD